MFDPVIQIWVRTLPHRIRIENLAFENKNTKRSRMQTPRPAKIAGHVVCDDFNIDKDNPANRLYLELNNEFLIVIYTKGDIFDIKLIYYDNFVHRTRNFSSIVSNYYPNKQRPETKNVLDPKHE